MAIQLMDRG